MVIPEMAFKFGAMNFNLISRDAEPPEPTYFGRSRSRSCRNRLLGAGAVKNGAAPAPKKDTFVAKNNGILTATK